MVGTFGGVKDRLNGGLRRVSTWWVFAACALWAGLVLWWALQNQLGPDPVAELTDRSGTLAIQLLVVGLLLTPIQRRLGLRVGRFKRVIGLSAFFYATLHLVVWAVLDLGLNVGLLASEIVERPFLALGMGAFVLLVPLALTSFNRAIKALGGLAWRRLHLLVYPAAILALVHFVLGSKVWEGDHLLWALLLAGALAERMVAAWERRRR